MKQNNALRIATDCMKMKNIDHLPLHATSRTSKQFLLYTHPNHLIEDPLSRNIRKDFRSISKTSSECQSLILEQNCIIRYRDTPAISDIEILLLKQKRSLPKEWIADWGNFLKCYHERIDPGTINYSQIVKTNPAFPIYARLLIDIWVRTTAMSKLDFNSFI